MQLSSYRKHINVIKQFLDTISLPFTTSKLYPNFLFWYSLCLYLLFIALTTSLNPRGCVTNYQYCTETQSCSLLGCISTTFIYIICLTTYDLPGYCRLRRQPFAPYFIYLYHFIFIDLELSRLCNSLPLQSLYDFQAIRSFYQFKVV